MPVPANPPEGTLPEGFKDWAEDVVESLEGHESSLLAGVALVNDRDILTKTGGSPAAVTREVLAVDEAFSGIYAPGFTTRAVGDGLTDDEPQLVADVTAAAAAKRPLGLLNRTYFLGAQVDLHDSVVRITGGGAILSRTHEDNALRIEPVAEAGGTCELAAAGATTITVTAAGWDVDEHAGKWVALPLGTYAAWSDVTTYAEDQIVEHDSRKWISTQEDNLNNEPALTSDYWRRLSSATKRRVVSNTADTLTLDYPIGNAVPALDIELYTPLERVEIEDLTLLGSGDEFANLVISYANTVILRRVRSRSCAGNAITVNFCGATNADEGYVLLDDCRTSDSNFGILVYNSDHVTVNIPKVRNWTGSYGVQLKDCRNGEIVNGWADGNDDGKNAFNLKGSGLNPGSSMRIVGGHAIRTTAAAYKIHTLQNEGDQFGLVGASIVGGYAEGCSQGWQVNEHEGPLSATVETIRSVGCGSGWAAKATDLVVRGPIAENCDSYGGNLFGGSGVRVEGARFVNNRQAGAGPELTMSTNDNLIVDPEFVHSDAGSLSDEAVEETGTANGNRVVGLRVRDTATGYAAKPFTLLGAGSVVEGWEDVLIPAFLMFKSTGSGSVSSGGGTYPNVGMQMPADVATRLHFHVPVNVRRDWDTARIVMVWRPTTTNTNTIRFNAIRDTWDVGETGVGTDGSELSLAGTPGGVANITQETAFVTTIDVTKELAAIAVSRDPVHAADTYPDTVMLIGVRLERVA